MPDAELHCGHSVDNVDTQDLNGLHVKVLSKSCEAAPIYLTTLTFFLSQHRCRLRRERCAVAHRMSHGQLWQYELFVKEKFHAGRGIYQNLSPLVASMWRSIQSNDLLCLVAVMTFKILQDPQLMRSVRISVDTARR